LLTFFFPVVDVNLDANFPVKDNSPTSLKDSHAALATSNYEVEENGADHSEIITSASHSLSSSSDLSPNTSQLFTRSPTPPPQSNSINLRTNSASNPSAAVPAEEDPRASISHGVPAPMTKSPSVNTFGSLKNSIAPTEDNLVIEGLGLNAAIVGERAEITIRSALPGNIADRLWGELVHADAQVPLIVEAVGRSRCLTRVKVSIIMQLFE